MSISEKLLEEIVLEMRDYVIKMKYHILYPHIDNMGILIDDKVKSVEENEKFKKALLECDIKVVKIWRLEDGREITIIDDLYGDYNLLEKLTKK